MEAAALKTISQSPTDPDFVQNPYSFYERARALGEVVWWEDYAMPVAVSHRAVNQVLKHRRMGRSSLSKPEDRPDHLRDFFRFEDASLMEFDGPSHSRLRNLIAGAFTTARIGEIGPFVVLSTDRLISEFPDGPFDFISHFASRLPTAVIGRLVGVPEEMGPQLLAWSHAMVAMYQSDRNRRIETEANAAARAFRLYLLDLIAARRDHPEPDLISALIAAQDTTQALTDDELVSTCILLLNAGHEATTHALGNALYTLMRLHQPFDVVVPHSVAPTVEELLRFDPPLHLFVREAHDDVAIGEAELQPGDRIGVCLAAANRDPRVFEACDTFDPTRPRLANLSFGGGAHFCVGAALARLELQVALPALYSKSLGLRLVEEPRYANRYHFHGLERLMVEAA